MPGLALDVLPAADGKVQHGDGAGRIFGGQAAQLGVRARAGQRDRKLAKPGIVPDKSDALVRVRQLARAGEQQALRRVVKRRAPPASLTRAATRRRKSPPSPWRAPRRNEQAPREACCGRRAPRRPAGRRRGRDRSAFARSRPARRTAEPWRDE